ncbi:MAG: serine hydrolase [Pirellulaceae bacterium]|nr:serine hydrolase [Pirellulaceae bacterium]
MKLACFCLWIQLVLCSGPDLNDNPASRVPVRFDPPTHRADGPNMLSRGEIQYPPTDDPFPTATPESHGIPRAALDRLAELVTGFVHAEEIVGAELLIIKNRRTILHEVFGQDDPIRGEGLQKNTIFSIRSMTKPLTGVTAQMLIDEEVLKLSDPVAKYLPSFDTDASRGITVEYLLTHRSGLPMRSAGTLWSNYGSYSNVRQLADYWGAYGPRLFAPGTQYHYADANVDTLAALIEEATDEPTEALIERRLLGPLKMRDTIPLLRDDDSRVERVAAKHAGGRGRWKPFWRWQGRPYFPFPMFAQGCYSTPVDYARFLAMVMDGGVVDGQRLLSEAAIARMLTPASKTTMPTGFAGLRSSYGQLIHLYDKDGELVAFGHSGSDGTYAWAWPGEDLMVLYFTQSRGSATMFRMEAVIDSLLARPVEPADD